MGRRLPVQQRSACPSPWPPSSSDAAAAQTGRRLGRRGRAGLPCRFGKYTLLRKLATGGMAELFLAIQKSVAGFEKLIVIKRILPAMNQDRAFIEMLLHEARIAATLSHPNIVQIFDVGAGRRRRTSSRWSTCTARTFASIVRQMQKKGVIEFPLEHALVDRARRVRAASPTRTRSATSTARRSTSSTATSRRRTSSSPSPAT